MGAKGKRTATGTVEVEVVLSKRPAHSAELVSRYAAWLKRVEEEMAEGVQVVEVWGDREWLLDDPSEVRLPFVAIVLGELECDIDMWTTGRSRPPPPFRPERALRLARPRRLVSRRVPRHVEHRPSGAVRRAGRGGANGALRSPSSFGPRLTSFRPGAEPHLLYPGRPRCPSPGRRYSSHLALFHLGASVDVHFAFSGRSDGGGWGSGRAR